MKDNFIETITTKSDSELETISKDYTFYSPEERMFALQELERRNKLINELSKIKQTIESEKEGMENIEPVKLKISLKDLLPQKSHLCTSILIYINTFIFILMLFSGVDVFNPDTYTLFRWGGNLRFSTLDGQYWRLLSSVFIHSGIVHLFCNMFALLYIGTILEKTIGRTNYIFAYLISGIIASASSIFIHSNIVSVGASGAIFGLFGVLLSLLLFKEFNIKDFSKKSLYPSVIFFVCYNILYALQNEGIDNAAHIGGLISGFLIGLVYYYVIKNKLHKSIAYISIITLFSFISTLSLFQMAQNVKLYNYILKKYTINEENALNIYKEDFNNIPKDKIPLIKEKIYRQGVVLWDTNICLIKILQQKNYPDEIQHRLQTVLEYTKLRKKSYETLIQLFDTSSEELSTEYILLDKQIEEKINLLNGSKKE